MLMNTNLLLIPFKPIYLLRTTRFFKKEIYLYIFVGHRKLKILSISKKPKYMGDSLVWVYILLS